MMLRPLVLALLGLLAPLGAQGRPATPRAPDSAYTHDAARMRFTLSALHAAVQDHFAKGGVEITSPAYMAIRQGDASTIPEMKA